MTAVSVDVSTAERFCADLLSLLSPTKAASAPIEGRDSVVVAVERFTGVLLSADQVRLAARACGVKLSPVGGSVAVHRNELRYACTFVGSRAAVTSGDLSWVRRPPRWDDLVKVAAGYGVEVPAL